MEWLISIGINKEVIIEFCRDILIRSIIRRIEIYILVILQKFTWIWFNFINSYWLEYETSVTGTLFKIEFTETFYPNYSKMGITIFAARLLKDLI